MEKNGKKWKLFLLLIIVYPYKNSSQMSILGKIFEKNQFLENFLKKFLASIWKKTQCIRRIECRCVLIVISEWRSELPIWIYE